MVNVVIEKMDNQGRGIAYINNKITFIPYTLPKEEVSVEITKETSKYQEAHVVEIIKPSPSRLKSPCPYFTLCGGCSLLHVSYEDTLKYKKENLENVLSKYANLKINIQVIPSSKPLHYRNKITLKVVNKEIGYYQESSHHLLPISSCLLSEPAINKFIPDIKHLNITNGELTIRTNYNQELLIWIKSKNKINPDISYLKSHHKIVGFILNDTPILGEDKFIEIINHQLFTISYNSFFQINRYVTSYLFSYLRNIIPPSNNVLDLYCGVGTLGINVAQSAKQVYGIEIVKNAVLNAITNSRLNKRNNIYYMLGDVSTCLPKIKEKIATAIIDPPRAGLDSNTKETLIQFHPSLIIYISCNPITLARDLKDLIRFYEVTSILGLDMFPYSKHIESICLLKLR